MKLDEVNTSFGSYACELSRELFYIFDSHQTKFEFICRVRLTWQLFRAIFEEQKPY